MSRCPHGLLDDTSAICDPAPTVSEMVTCSLEVGPSKTKIFLQSVVQVRGSRSDLDLPPTLDHLQ